MAIISRSAVKTTSEAIAGLVLAAGRASRMYAIKPLLAFNRQTAIEQAISCLLGAGIDNIIVVTGYQAEVLSPVLNHLPVRVVHNPNYQAGMYTSIRVGLTAISDGARGFCVLPADMPLVSPATVALLARTFLRTDADVVYPVYQGYRGHPPLVSTRLVSAMRKTPGEGGLCDFLVEQVSTIVEVAVTDEGVSLDMDTPLEYSRLLRYAELEGLHGSADYSLQR